MNCKFRQGDKVICKDSNKECVVNRVEINNNSVCSRVEGDDFYSYVTEDLLEPVNTDAVYSTENLQEEAVTTCDDVYRLLEKVRVNTVLKIEEVYYLVDNINVELNRLPTYNLIKAKGSPTKIFRPQIAINEITPGMLTDFKVVDSYIIPVDASNDAYTRCVKCVDSKGYDLRFEKSITSKDQNFNAANVVKSSSVSTKESIIRDCLESTDPELQLCGINLAHLRDKWISYFDELTAAIQNKQTVSCENKDIFKEIECLGNEDYAKVSNADKNNIVNQRKLLHDFFYSYLYDINSEQCGDIFHNYD